MAEHPIENLMVTAMSSIESMIDVNTIVGDVVSAQDGTIIIPVSKVTFGFAAGGSEFNTNKENEYPDNPKFPFGGGSGAGVNISPTAFLVVKDSNVRLLTLDGTTPVDKIIELFPDVLGKISGIAEKTFKKPSKMLENKSEVKNERRLRKSRNSKDQDDYDKSDNDDEEFEEENN